MDIGHCTGIAADRAKSEGAACDFRDVLPQAAALAVAYLFNPFLLNAVAWDFHPVTLAVPLVALALLAVDSGDGRLLVGCCLPMLLVQEQMGLMVAGFGALYLATLLITFLFLPLGGLAYCPPALGDLAANLLSANPMPRNPYRAPPTFGRRQAIGRLPIRTSPSSGPPCRTMPPYRCRPMWGRTSPGGAPSTSSPTASARWTRWCCIWTTRPGNWGRAVPANSPPWPTTCRCGPPSGVGSAPGFHPFFGDKGMVVRIEPAFA